MIDKFCNWITKKIKNKMPEIDEERELVIDFGVKLLFGELPKIFLLFFIGFLLDIGWYTIILFFLIAPYRSFTGGFHLKTHFGCMLSTTILYTIPIILAKYMTIPPNKITYILTVMIGIVSIILITKYAPADTENIPVVSQKERRSKKRKAYISLAILLLISILVPNQIVKYMLLYGIALQNLTIMPISYKLTKCKYGYQNYTEEIS